MLLPHVLCRACVLLWQMVKRGVLTEPKTAAQLAELTPKGRVGSTMSEQARKDPSNAKYMGQCCGGTRIWGDGDAAVYKDTCSSLCPCSPVPFLWAAEIGWNCGTVSERGRSASDLMPACTDHVRDDELVAAQPSI